MNENYRTLGNLRHNPPVENEELPQKNALSLVDEEERDSTLVVPAMSAEPQKVEVIAELSANHRQNLDIALQTMRAMQQSGADSVKLQSYDAQSLTLPLEAPPFLLEVEEAQKGGEYRTPWDGRSLYSLYTEAAMPWEWHKPLFRLASHLGLHIFSTPFCLRGVDFLEQLNTPRYKIASFEIGHLELVRRVASTKKPIIASLGIASFSDIERFLETCHKEGNQDITLLQCTSAYPASIADANLAMIPHLKSTFGCRIGLSDHSLGATVAVAAVVLGAEVIEKHFILSKEVGGPDASFSMEPQEFAAMVQEIRRVSEVTGKVEYRLSPQKQHSRRLGRAIFVLKDLKRGTIITREDIEVLRPFPEGAIEPYHIDQVVGSILTYDIPYGTYLKWNMLQ